MSKELEEAKKSLEKLRQERKSLETQIESAEKLADEMWRMEKDMARSIERWESYENGHSQNRN